MEKVRIDKWLWAARFFKTRSLAKQAIDGGKVHCGGQRVKPSKEIETGVHLTVRQGWDEKEIEVIKLSDQRRGAPEAILLYQETPASIQKREEQAVQRKALRGIIGQPEHRPTKKQRRQIHRFREQDFE
ncbi:MAG: ribosome-associated heat shock protein Hsp15 [Candidatus Pelagadaptatus aseana]|uniref:RNA-binding S4 domain-containing protein n=1 Tax=Candidatus Pelagadaptatus aseana TaxID=3120508 RepID=UPI0039B280AD